MFKIFVSSTYLDLKDHRKAVEEAINDRGQKFLGMEYLGALDAEPTEACLNLVEECDLFIGIYAWRYGSTSDNSPFSITEQEYRYAEELKRPRICYLIDPKYPWLPEFMENNDALKAFKKLVEKDRVRDTFQDPKDLKSKFVRDFSKWLEGKQTHTSRKDSGPVIKNAELNYRQAIANKYATLVMLGDLKRSFDMDEIYIPLTMHFDAESRQIGRKPDFRDEFYGRSLKAEDLLPFPAKVAVVLGEPGMGKTTMLHYLARHEGKAENGLFPIFLKLADFSRTRDNLETALLAAVGNHVSSPDLQTFAQHALQKGTALILLDGMDEVRRDEYTSVTERIRAFVSSHPACHTIITSRKAGFQNQEFPFSLFEIDRLPLTEIKNYVDKWFAGETELAQKLMDCVQNNQRIQDLAQNPFLLSIICLIYEKDKSLPQRRIELYEKCTFTLLTLRDDERVPRSNVFLRKLKESALENLACHFFGKGVDEFLYDDIIDQMTRTFKELEKEPNEESLLREICENSGLLQKSGQNYFFVHRTFYEYYVARKMRRDGKDILSHAPEPRWEEPLRLFAAQIIPDDDGKKEGTQFFEKLWQQDQALALRCYPDMAQVVAPDLIKKYLNEADIKGRIELVKGLPEKIADKEKVIETLGELFRWETNGEVLWWGVEILEKNGSPKAREIVHQRLDQGAEERFQKYLAKDFVKIPAGKFKMGSNEYDDEQPIHEVYLDEFGISRYLVTNKLYEIFDPAHRKQRDKYSDRDDQPVIYVNWYEATIFARWLGCQLPSEAQWEKAARGDKNLEYATKDGTISHQLANYEHKVGKTTPVGKYPPNPFGLYDMSGNVWEWCRDWKDVEGGKKSIFYQKSDRSTNPVNDETGEWGKVGDLMARVLRGGSWINIPFNLRAAFRDWVVPTDWNYFVGFRCSRAYP